MNKNDIKVIRKAAFAVGVGFTVGKNVGSLINAGISGVYLGMMKSLAKHGNEVARDICERCDIEYEESDKKKKESDKVVMGFHA